jgi:hypothetical protein
MLVAEYEVRPGLGVDGVVVDVDALDPSPVEQHLVDVALLELHGPRPESIRGRDVGRELGQRPRGSPVGARELVRNAAGDGIRARIECAS